MDEKELDKILEEIQKRANAAAPIEPPKPANHDEIKNNTPTVKEEKKVEAKIQPPEDINFSFESKEETLHKAVDDFSMEFEKPQERESVSDPVSIFYSESMNDEAEYEEIESSDNKTKNKKKLWIIPVAIVLIVAIGVGVYFLFMKDKDKEPETTTQPKTSQTVQTTQEDLGPLNPLTGETGYNAEALSTRPVAVVVENEYSTESVRPQWALNEADIVLEGESEFSTRMLLFWADYTDVPEQVGPARSARPPFIHFSQLFDSVFIHAGLSKSKGNYVGADSVFRNENIDHVNLLSLSESGGYFGRDRSRGAAVEHTGYLNGTNVPKLLEEKNIRTELNENRFTVLNFNKKAAPVSDTACEKVAFKWSGNCPKKGVFTYDAEGGYYTTTDFDSRYGEANLKFSNLILLLDKTEYIVKENYKSSGNSETYCDYKLSGGEGKVLSQGTVVDITWGVSNGKLWMKDSQGKEIQLNPGKSYIGYGSSNHGGSITVNPED